MVDEVDQIMDSEQYEDVNGMTEEEKEEYLADLPSVEKEMVDIMPGNAPVDEF